MRHAVKGRKLGRTTAHRESLFRNQLQSLVLSERIVTTLPKAKELKPLAEKMITRGKDGTVHARRWVLRWVAKRELVKKVFDEIAPRFETRPGGYTRISKLGPRQGDGAEMAVLEFLDRPDAAVVPAAEEKNAKPKKVRKDVAPAKSEKPKKEKPVKEARPAKPTRGDKGPGGKAAAKTPTKRVPRGQQEKGGA